MDRDIAEFLMGVLLTVTVPAAAPDFAETAMLVIRAKTALAQFATPEPKED